ncbi:methyltransferase family protein [Chloroflexota bacterium]
MMEQKPKVGRYKKWERRRRDVVFTSLAVLFFIAQVVMCIILYNQYTDGLMILGWIVMGIAIFGVGGLSWYAVSHQTQIEDREWLKDTVLVDTGIYEVIRHPVYFSFMLYVIALMFISQHWVTIILGIPVVAYLYWTMKQEEWASVDKFGEEYVDYMDRVPRLNIVTGLINYYKKRKGQQY